MNFHEMPTIKDLFQVSDEAVKNTSDNTAKQLPDFWTSKITTGSGGPGMNHGQFSFSKEEFGKLDIPLNEQRTYKVIGGGTKYMWDGDEPVKTISTRHNIYQKKLGEPTS